MIEYIIIVRDPETGYEFGRTSSAHTDSSQALKTFEDAVEAHRAWIFSIGVGTLASWDQKPAEKP